MTLWLALLLAVAPPQVVVSVDRPFLPRQPAVVRVEGRMESLDSLAAAR